MRSYRIVVVVALAGCSLSEPRFTPSGGPTGETATLMPAAPSYDFGTVVTGSASAPATFSFVNAGSVATGELAQARVSGDGAVLFAIGADGCAGRTLAPAESCSVEAVMSPSSEGVGNAMLTVTAEPGGGAMVALSGKAVTSGALKLAPTTATYPPLAPGDVSLDKAFTATNTGGSPTGTITVTLSGTDATQFAIASDSCTGATLAAGGSCTIKARFAPRAAGGKAASLTATSIAGGTGVATLGGHALLPAALVLAPPSNDFGSVVVGGLSATTAFTVTNTGELPSGSVTTALSGADGGQYQLVSDDCAGHVVAPAGSCTITVAFAPTTTGMKPVQLTAGASPGGGASSALSGTGIPPAALAFDPPSNNFGTVDVGAMTTATFKLTNTGGQPTSTITTSLLGSNASELALASDGCTNQTLAAGASCNVTVSFAPASYGSKSATLQASAGVGGLTAASLSGTGRDKVTLTVSTSGGGGTGTVACNQAACAAQYYRGTMLTLAETPDANMTFGGWSGACSGTTATCSITLAGNTTVTAAFLPANQDLTIATSGLGGATGTITTSPAGTSCGAGCLRFPTGTPVTLTASPTAGYYLSAWSGGCLGNGLTCQLTMTAPRSAAAQYAPANLAFVTSGSYVPSPNNTIRWANTTCQAAAQAAGLPGNYIGWLGSAAASWDARLGTASGWVRRDGKPFATTRAELVAGHSLYPNRVDEHGAAVAMTTLVLSGSSGYDCAGWTEDASSGTRQMPGLAGGGWGQAATYDWYDYDANLGTVACGTPMPLYCFGVDYHVNLTYPKASGRIAFVGVQQFANAPNGGGIAALDSFCADKATAAGLPGTYRALVATTTATAASRFSTAGQPWVRADGVQLVALAAHLFAGSGPALTASLDVDEHGAGVFALALAGAPDFNSLGTPASTCNNYTDNTTTANDLLIGYGTFVDPALFGFGHYECASGGSVYCLQQ
jgi:HYDIN/CFA65/VesB family protein/List-Bact-rpt repeat protein